MVEDLLRIELGGLLDNGWAYEDPKAILANFPMEQINTFPPNVPYTTWQLLEHVRFCQQEILEQIEADDMPAYSFPDDFWPLKEAKATPEMWDDTVRRFFADRDRFMEMARCADLSSLCRNNTRATVLHALLNIAAHNHYHFGEFAVLRQVMNTWPEDRGQ
jgi:hypothetical protein